MSLLGLNDILEDAEGRYFAEGENDTRDATWMQAMLLAHIGLQLCDLNESLKELISLVRLLAIEAEGT